MKMVIVRKCYPGLCATAFLAGLLAVPCRAGEVGDYLTRDGKLKEAVTVRMGVKNFLAPPDEVWVIQPSGDWVWESTDSAGKLHAKQLAALAQHLATQGFNSTPQNARLPTKACGQRLPLRRHRIWQEGGRLLHQVG